MTAYILVALFLGKSCLGVRYFVSTLLLMPTILLLPAMVVNSYVYACPCLTGGYLAAAHSLLYV